MWSWMFAFRREWLHLSVLSSWHCPHPHHLTVSISHFSSARCPLVGGNKPSTGLHIALQPPPVVRLLRSGLGSIRQQHETQYWPAHHF